LLHRIPPHKLAYKYKHDLFCNEIMLLPYYIASLNIEHEYYAKMGEYEPFEGVCFVDTLELAEELHSYQGGIVQQSRLMVTEANTERVDNENAASIMVVIANPPYNVGQENENDNNKNRKYPVIDGRVRETYAKASKASNKNALSDAYVKFFRWATDRLEERDGIVCFVSNNGFLNGIAFDGFRKLLLDDFNLIYHFDFKGNARTSGERRRKEGGNIFDDKIRTGIGITLLIRSKQLKEKKVFYHCVDDYWSAEQKRVYLHSFNGIKDISWQALIIDANHNWLINDLPTDFLTFIPMGTKEAKSEHIANLSTVFKNYGRGVATSRDNWAYDFGRNQLEDKIEHFIDTYNSEVDHWKRRGNNTKIVDDFVTYDDTKIKWSRDLKLDLQRGHYAEFAEAKVRTSMYRPYCNQWLFFDRILNEEVYQFPQIFPTQSSEKENIVICLSGIGSNKPFQCLASNIIPCLDLLEKTQCFPYYTYNEDGTNRQENITDWSLAQFQAKYGPGVTKWDIFHYVYAMLHHPQYRERYAENLKRDLPHIPLLHSVEPFQTCVRIGRQLMDLHLNYEQTQEYNLEWLPNNDVPFSWIVEKMRLSHDKRVVVVNESLRLGPLPPECFEYRLGNRSALEWVIDQYQVSKDARSGIESDPNRADDQEYIIRLVCRVVTVSVETVRLVRELAAAVTMEDWMA
jgi:predicted helicase